MNRAYRLIILAVAAAVALSACAANPKAATSYSPRQIAEAVISAQGDISALLPLLPDDGYYADYITDIYQMDADKIKDGAIYYASGMQADEIAVFLVSGKSGADDAREALLRYADHRADVFMGYAPEQAAKLENGIVAVRGDYVALLVCKDPQKAESTFLACFSGKPPKIGDISKPSASGSGETAGVDPSAPGNAAATDSREPASTETETPAHDPSATGNPATGAPATDSPTSDPHETDSPLPPSDPATNTPATGTPATDTAKPDGSQTDAPVSSTHTPTPPATADDGSGYDSAAILKAWRGGDASGLSTKNRKILDVCSETIKSVIADGMSEYDKELAIHDWIVEWTGYDEEKLSHSPDAKPDPDHDNPYGAIFGKKAICSGYTSTFQLFMDMLGIECMTVNGCYSKSGEDHAWNMVRIDGDWYCVDVTWDDPLGGPWPASVRHMYFNVTTLFMIETGHQWDESATPVADAGKLYVVKD